jgi:hypothetical protein
MSELVGLIARTPLQLPIPHLAAVRDSYFNSRLEKEIALRGGSDDVIYGIRSLFDNYY